MQHTDNADDSEDFDIPLAEIGDNDHAEVENAHSLLRYNHHLVYARDHDPQWKAYCERMMYLLSAMRKMYICTVSRKILLSDLPEEILIHIMRFFDYKSCKPPSHHISIW